MTASFHSGSVSLIQLVGSQSQHPALGDRQEGDAPNHARLSPEVVDRDLEEALDLARVEVHGDDVVAARDLEHVGDELGGDGRPRLVFAVLSRARSHQLAVRPRSPTALTMREYGKQGMTAVMRFALAVLQAEMRMRSSIKRSFGSLNGSGWRAC